MFELISFTWYFFIQAFGLILAFAAAAVFIYLALRRAHSARMTIALVVAFLGISVFLYLPNQFPQGFQLPFSLTTFGPSAGPTLPFSNVISFFSHFNKFERISDIARDPNDLPPPLTRTATTSVAIDLTAKEVIAQMAPGIWVNYWTFNGAVPGPFFRVKEGDLVTVTLHNDATSLHHHSLDLHSVVGPGGGAAVLMAAPGESAMLTFTALHPGIFVYHCAEPDAALHMAHGQYGLILVEPREGLPKVDKEFYVMQGEFYEAGALGRTGLQLFDANAMLDGKPQYIVFNGKVGGLNGKMEAQTGQKVRIFFGDAGVNLASNFHVIGEIFDTVYREGSLTSAPETDVQTTLVPAGGATAVEFSTLVPGSYTLVDHALARVDRGAWGTLTVNGPENKAVFDGVIQAGHGH
jgi:nitrite reductase (NO-forming)